MALERYGAYGGCFDCVERVWPVLKESVIPTLTAHLVDESYYLVDPVVRILKLMRMVVVGGCANTGAEGD